MGVEGTAEEGLARTTVVLVLLAVATALVTGTAVVLLGFVFPQLRDDPPGEPVPTAVEQLTHLPAVATALVALALLAALTTVALVLRRSPARAEVVRCAVLVAGPAALVLGTRVVPLVVTPCWGGELPQVCGAEPGGGARLLGTVHPFWTAVSGWLPLGLLAVWSLRRWWPEAVPAWVPGASPRSPAG